MADPDMIKPAPLIARRNPGHGRTTMNRASHQCQYTHSINPPIVTYHLFRACLNRGMADDFQQLFWDQTSQRGRDVQIANQIILGFLIGEMTGHLRNKIQRGRILIFHAVRRHRQLERKNYESMGHSQLRTDMPAVVFSAQFLCWV